MGNYNGLGGSAAASMVASIKNNKRARPKTFKKLKEYGKVEPIKKELLIKKLAQNF